MRFHDDVSGRARAAIGGGGGSATTEAVAMAAAPTAAAAPALAGREKDHVPSGAGTSTPSGATLMVLGTNDLKLV